MAAALPAVTLGRLGLRASAAELPGARARLLADLDRVDWPAGAGEDEIVLIRSLAVRGVIDRLAAQAARAAGELAREAVDGWSARADDAQAVRFASADAMAACLLRDLLHEQAARRWFWRRRQAGVLALPPGAALAAVLCERPLALPELLGQLGEHAPGLWPRLWQVLDEPAARQVLAAVAAATGWTLQARAGTAHDEPAAATPAGSAPGDLASGPAAGWRHDWQALAASLAGLRQASGHGEAPPQARLAALWLLWRHQPAVLGRAGTGAQCLASLAQALLAGRDGAAAGRRPGPPPPAPAAAGDGKTGPWPQDPDGPQAHGTGAGLQPPPWRHDPATAAPGQPQGGAWGGASGGTPAAALGPGPGAASPVPGPDAPTHGVPGPTAARPPAGTGADTTSRPHAAAADPADAPASPARAGLAGTHDFVTTGGGLFYLLNILKLRGVQALLMAGPGAPGSDLASASEPAWAMPGCGWRWLGRLGLLAGVPFDAALRRFLAAQARLDGLDGPGLQGAPGNAAGLDHLPAFPALPGEAQVLALARARVGPALWHDPATWARPAHVVATRSHVDVHLRSNDVSLALRRCGLDIDPGWLPWLGRVVHLHYGGALAPRDGPPADRASHQPAGAPGVGASSSIEPTPP